jgi:hypothetical protein
MDVFDVGFHRRMIASLYPDHWDGTDNLPDMWYIRPPGLTDADSHGWVQEPEDFAQR